MSRHQEYKDSQPSKLPLPFAAYLPFLAGITTGLLMRFIFSEDESDPTLSVMSGAFVFGAPLLIGAVTVLVAERIAPRRWPFYAGSGALAALLFIVGTMLIMIEGLICAAIISPLFALLGTIGGLIMGAACRLGRHVIKTLHSFVLLPLAFIAFEANTELPTHTYAIERSTLVDAPNDVVWQQIRNLPTIDESEVEEAWVFRIGVPMPLSAVSVTDDIPIRRITMGKHVYFDQVIEEWREGAHVRWTYRFYEDSFPAHAMDDHVRIGGTYFDLIDTSYTLTPEQSQTRLTVRFQYRLSTRFNWYAGPLLEELLENAADTYLQLYAERASHSANVATAEQHP